MLVLEGRQAGEGPWALTQAISRPFLVVLLLICAPQSLPAAQYRPLLLLLLLLLALGHALSARTTPTAEPDSGLSALCQPGAGPPHGSHDLFRHPLARVLHFVWLLGSVDGSAAIPCGPRVAAVCTRSGGEHTPGEWPLLVDGAVADPALARKDLSRCRKVRLRESLLAMLMLLVHHLICVMRGDAAVPASLPPPLVGHAFKLKEGLAIEDTGPRITTTVAATHADCIIPPGTDFVLIVPPNAIHIVRRRTP